MDIKETVPHIISNRRTRFLFHNYTKFGFPGPIHGGTEIQRRRYHLNICHLPLLHWSPEPRQLLLAHLKQPSPQLEYFTNKPHSVLLFETKLAKPQIKVSTAEEVEEVMLLLIDPSCPTSCVVMTGWPSLQIYWSIVMSGNDYYGSGIQLTRYSQ